MILFQKTNLYPIQDLDQKEKSISTLLIPKLLVESLKLQSKQNGNSVASYLHSLLRKYRTLTHTGLLPLPKKIKTEYQNENQDLQRINFRVSNSDWLELGELALAYGKSRCWIFTFLLEIDLTCLWEYLVESNLDNAVPTIIFPRLIVSWSLDRKRHKFSRSYHVKT